MPEPGGSLFHVGRLERYSDGLRTRAGILTRGADIPVGP